MNTVHLHDIKQQQINQSKNQFTILNLVCASETTHKI